MGIVSTMPTGGDTGCTTTGASSFTPGWCTGGSTLLSGGYFSTSLTFEPSTRLHYVGPSNGQVRRFHADSGQVLGTFTQRVTSLGFTGGATGCSAVPRWGIAPGWCTEGNMNAPQYFSADLNGAVNTVADIAVDGSTGRIYFTDSGFSRIYRLQ